MTKWKCLKCGEIHSDLGIMIHFDNDHPEIDASDILDNYLEKVRDGVITGICLILSKLHDTEVIERDGKYYKTNHKGMEEELL